MKGFILEELNCYEMSSSSFLNQVLNVYMIESLLELKLS
mgnify:CR=1 FL=1